MGERIGDGDWGCGEGGGGGGQAANVDHTKDEIYDPVAGGL